MTTSMMNKYHRNHCFVSSYKTFVWRRNSLVYLEVHPGYSFTYPKIFNPLHFENNDPLHVFRGGVNFFGVHEHIPQGTSKYTRKYPRVLPRILDSTPGYFHVYETVPQGTSTE